MAARTAVVSAVGLWVGLVASRAAAGSGLTGAGKRRVAWGIRSGWSYEYSGAARWGMRVAWWKRGTPPRAVTIAWWMPLAPTCGLGMVMSWWREASRRAAAARAATVFPAPTSPVMTVIWRVPVP